MADKLVLAVPSVTHALALTGVEVWVVPEWTDSDHWELWPAGRQPTDAYPSAYKVERDSNR